MSLANFIYLAFLIAMISFFVGRLSKVQFPNWPQYVAKGNKLLYLAAEALWDAYLEFHSTKQYSDDEKNPQSHCKSVYDQIIDYLTIQEQILAGKVKK